MKCSSYHEDIGAGFGMVKARCYGTKECEQCWCEGDESQCDFYPEKRNKARTEETLNTAEMWLKAQNDGKEYIEADGLASYSLDKGFEMINCNVDNVIDLSDWLIRRWKANERRKITKAEAEKEFNIKIID